MNSVIQKLKILFVSAMAISLIVGIFVPVKSYALFEGSKQQACQGVNLSDTGTCDPKSSAKTINDTIAAALNILSFAVGVAAVIMIIVGGIKFILASGDSAATNSARNTVLYAIIGLIVALMAQIIVHFVLNRFPKG